MHNLLQTTLMLASMTALTALVGWVLAGMEGLVVTGLFCAGFMLFGRGASARLLLQAMGAEKLERDDIPALFAILDELTRRAGLERSPDLYVLESEMMLGFSTGADRSDAAIVLTNTLLQGLSPRELAGVMGHELSHIQSGDLSVLGLADLVTRMTRILSLFGIVLMLLNVPLSLSGKAGMPWAALALLVAAPLASFLIQMALSRAREFEADAEGVHLTGDREAAASALYKLEVQQESAWRRMFWDARPDREPSLLRSHPVTEERVRHILAITPRQPPLSEALVGSHHGFPQGWSGALGMPLRWLLRWWR